MANLTFTIPSVLNQGGGEKKVEISANNLADAFAKISETMGDDFKRRVLEGDGTPRSLINIYINGKNAKFSSGMETELKDGDDIYIEKEIPFTTAVLGGKVEVPGIEKVLNVTVPAGTKDGSLLRLKNQGFYKTGSEARGNQLVEIRINIPKRLTKVQRELLEKLKKAEI